MSCHKVSVVCLSFSIRAIPNSRAALDACSLPDLHLSRRSETVYITAMDWEVGLGRNHEAKCSLLTRIAM